ncbi:transporter, major facilitator family [Synechococcus sp. PCC 7335]|uniref:MFS transporter n=1 Tax=Synechococcus sp. (strain ATCC 29403 / PCC 7335) TaxID=91464 RepID=UPI00017EC417|nr:MFS transporter [Synechococcus sp. PCC 7335]EDX85940.1 transporter, major facilitator family [Synechococcus sp. PCC 7335]
MSNPSIAADELTDELEPNDSSFSLQSKFQTELDSSPLTRPMWMLWVLSAGLIALDGFDFFIIGVAMPFIQRDFGLNAGWVGAIATAALVGALIGSLTLGPVTDQVGRQRMLVIDIGLFIAASLGSALAWDAWSLLFFRFLVGVGIGADYPISVSYITENIPARLRGRMVIGAFSFQSIGALLGALIGWLTIWLFQQTVPELAIAYAWRWMLGVGVALSVLVGGLRLLFLLESPSYYLAKGDYKAASEAASELLEKPILLEPNASIKATDADEAKATLGYYDLFSKAYIRQTALASIPWFLQDIATYGIGIFTPTIIATLAFSSAENLLTQEMASARGAAVVNVFLVLGFVIAVLSIDRIGRIPLQVAGFIGMAIGLGLLSFSGSTTQIGLLFTGFILFNLTMNLGPNSTTFLLSGEVFPPAIRASGAGLAGAIAKLGAVLGALSLPVLQESLGISNLLRLLAAVCVLAALITYSLRKAASTAISSP